MMDHSYSLKHLENLSTDDSYYQHKVSSTDIRLKAVQEAALSLGMQSGLYVESKRINKELDGQSQTLDTIFNFNLIVYKQHVLPPVIEHAKGSLNLGPMSQTIRINGETYNIIKQVRFVTAPPTWRDYIWMNFKPPKLTNRVLLPKNDKERAIWKTNVSKGYDEGIHQAVQIFNINLNLLKRDYNGMVLYEALLLKGMVSPFYVTGKNHGITGDGSHLVIDDHSMQIKLQPQLNLHSTLWQPIITNPDENLPSHPTGPNVVYHQGKWTGGPHHAPVLTASPIEVNKKVSELQHSSKTKKATSAPIKKAKPVKSSSSGGNSHETAK